MIPKKEYPHKAERKTDRIVVLKPMPGKKVLSGTGMPDPRLFSGDNELHIYKNLQDSLWSIRYKMGGVPEPLKQSFTTFDKALNHVEKYFERRNVVVDHVID